MVYKSHANSTFHKEESRKVSLLNIFLSLVLFSACKFHQVQESEQHIGFRKQKSGVNHRNGTLHVEPSRLLLKVKKERNQESNLFSRYFLIPTKTLTLNSRSLIPSSLNT